MGVFSGRAPGGALESRLASPSLPGWLGALVRGAARLPGAPGRRGSAEAGTPRRAGGGRAYKGPRAAREGGSEPPSSRPAQLGLREPPRSARCARRGAGPAHPRDRRGGGGARGGARVPADQLGDPVDPPGVLAAARGTCGHPPCEPWRAEPGCPAQPLSAAAVQRPRADPPAPSPRRPRAWSGTCSARCSTGCCCLSRSWRVSRAGSVSSGLGQGYILLPTSRPRGERGRPGRGPGAGVRGDSPGRAALAARIPEA